MFLFFLTNLLFPSSSFFFIFILLSECSFSSILFLFPGPISFHCHNLFPARFLFQGSLQCLVVLGCGSQEFQWGTVQQGFSTGWSHGLICGEPLHGSVFRFLFLGWSRGPGRIFQLPACRVWAWLAAPRAGQG